MREKITRRAFGPGLVAAGLAARPPASSRALAQTAAAREDASQLLDAQRATRRQNAARLDAVKLPQATEPAFRFEA